jgi:hypothetical protein
MESTLAKSFDEAGTGDRFWALWLAQLLAANRLARNKALDIATKLDALAQKFAKKGDLRCARDYYGDASKWFEVAGDTAKAVEATVAVAESWVTEGLAQLSSEKPSYSQAASNFENAIQTYRMIPGSYRDTHGVDDRISDLHRRMNDAGERAPEELGIIRSAPIDISETVERARGSVKGKSGLDALKGLAELTSGIQFKESRKSAERTLREHPLLAALPATHIARDGRVIAKRPGGIGDAGSEEYEANVWAQMIRDYSIYISLTVQGQILPALEILNLEHHFKEIDFVSIALRSPIVPLGREHLFGKALFVGIERDFSAALHLLIPQVENMVRFHLKASGRRTTTLSQAGIQHELGLSGLMDLLIVDEILGEDLAFEFRALFCDPLGPNLRNEVAHGLLDDGSSQSIHSVYAWWLALRLTFITFWNAVRRPKNAEGELHEDA